MGRGEPAAWATEWSMNPSALLSPSDAFDDGASVKQSWANRRSAAVHYEVME
jgi:hypothetical protein